MFDSRDLIYLHPDFRSKMLSFKSEYELKYHAKLLVTCTVRDTEAQEDLYNRGRISAGAIVTDAKPGDSFHNYGLATDAYPIINGKPLFVSHDPEGVLLVEWDRYGTLAAKYGFEWAGNWHGKLIEYPHVQLGGLTLEQIKANPTKYPLFKLGESNGPTTIAAK